MNKKPKHCRVCKAEFQPFNSLHKACSPKCALELAVSAREKKERKEWREAKVKLKSRSDWLRESQAVCNKFIRLRDQGKPCISCDKPDDGSHQRHASHYRPTGNCSPLRFHEMNIHASCMQCNSHKSGNLIPYRGALVSLYGAELVEWMEGQNQPFTWEIDDIKAVKEYYRLKIQALSTTQPNSQR